MTKSELKKAINKLEKELVEENKNNGFTKRSIFLESTIAVYTDELKKFK